MENIIPDYSHVQQSIRPKPDRLLSRIDAAPQPPPMHIPPFRRSLRFPRRDPFFHHRHHNNNNFFAHAAASEQIDIGEKSQQQ